MSLNVDSQVLLLTDKLANQAVGQLYAALGFVMQTTRWVTIDKLQNGATFNIPLLGTATSNTRAPGADVVDQTPTPARRQIVVVEQESSFIVDPTWAASEGSVKYLEQQIQSHINILAEDVLIDILQTIATTAGLQTVGTLGVSLVKASYDGARQALTEGRIPMKPRIAVVSPDMMTDTLNVPEYADFDQSGVAGSNPMGQVAQAAGFTVMESPYVHSPAGGQHIGFATQAESIWTVFPMQEVFNKGEVAVKTETDLDGLRLYILREYVPKKNGGERWTMSIRYGARVGRDEGVILINGV